MRHRFDIIIRVKIAAVLSLLAVQPAARVWAAGPEGQAETSAVNQYAAREGDWQNLFGVMTVRTNRIAGHERWRSMLKRASAGCIAECPPAWRSWTQMVHRLDGISRYAQIKSVNWSANAALTWRSDVSAFGKKDYWASPVEALRRGGDCEDFVALKYLALRAAGFPEEDLRIVVLQDLQRGQPHAVLVARAEGVRYVLDNQFDDVVEDLELDRYRPLYSFNANGKWVHLEVRKRQAVAMID